MFRRIPFLVTAVVAVFSLGMHAAEATWSVVGVDPTTGEVGVAVASCVGFEVTVVPVIVPGIGAAASQADISSVSGQRFVDALAADASAQAALDAVVAADDDSDARQFGVVVLDGGGAGWTGSETMDVALDRRSTDGTASAQGNILVSDEVVGASIEAFEQADGTLADRLLAGLVAGADAGGDSRCGDQTATSAALLVGTPGDTPYSHTDGGVLGVDPEQVAVPSVFVSVLVESGGDRAPDRLSQAWESADRAAPTIVIRQIDDGADSSATRAQTTATVLLGAVALFVILGIVAAIWIVARRARR